MKLLVADKRKRVDPNIPNEAGDTALSKAAKAQDVPMLELLLADDRTTCARPFFSPSNQAYDVALRNAKRRRDARFRGLVRFVLLLEPMRLQAATKVYAPGGAGFAAAAASFRAAAMHSKGPVSRPACASSTATPATPAMPGRRRQRRRRRGRRRQRRR